MIFKNFRLQIVWRTVLLALVFGGGTYFLIHEQYMFAGIATIASVIIISSLIHYVESTNRKVTFFLESIENADFTVKFSRDSKYGKSFRQLNEAFNHVLDAFREVRAEKEEHLQYLNTVVQYVRVGLISFDQHGKIELFNNAAIKLLGTPYIRNISELKRHSAPLFKILIKLKPGDNTLLKLSKNNQELQLSVTATELRLRGKAFKLVSLQNIQPELQQKEIESWQNLAKVLRHEIMNSITPIVSHVETLNEILNDELSWTPDTQLLTIETTQDVTNALKTIEKRSKGLLHFINAYRSFSEVPRPKFGRVKVLDLLERLVQLFDGEVKKQNTAVALKVVPADLEISADQEQMETVLINLFKNALEAVGDSKNPKIVLSGKLDEQSHILIEIQDNGPGIIPEARDQIFIPFYTTKEKGSGIGLSLSRQIIQLHHGKLMVKSDPEKSQTVFTIMF